MRMKKDTWGPYNISNEKGRNVVNIDLSADPRIDPWKEHDLLRAIQTKAGEMQKDLDIEALKLDYKNTIMSQWLDTIIDKWICSSRRHEFYKYWKITSVYVKVNDRNYRYSPVFDHDETEVVFQGYFCRMWDDDEARSYLTCRDQGIDNFNFNRYRLVSDKNMIESLDFGLAKNLLEEKVVDIVKDYDFDEYF